MATAIPRSTFQKLGLTAIGLKTSFSTLSSALSTLRTDSGSGSKMTLRIVEKETVLPNNWIISEENGWDIYHETDHSSDRRLLCKLESNSAKDDSLVAVKMSDSVIGVAIKKYTFAEGVERLSFRCTEIAYSNRTSVLCNMTRRLDLEGMAVILMSVELETSRYKCKLAYWGEIIGNVRKENLFSPSAKFDVLAGLNRRHLNGIAVRVIHNSDGKIRVRTIVTQAEHSTRASNLLERHQIYPPIADGPRLVAKESKYVEKLSDFAFQKQTARMLTEADQYASTFNRLVKSCFNEENTDMQVNFLKCCVYHIQDDKYRTITTRFCDQPRGLVVAEPELKGVYTKWNNNAGKVNLSNEHFESLLLKSRYPNGEPSTTATVDNRISSSNIMHSAIFEESDEDEDEDDWYAREERRRFEVKQRKDLTLYSELLAHVPQCFSHYTYVVSEDNKKQRIMICDLQGVWNLTDGFTFTDPVIHLFRKGQPNGLTDKGKSGMAKFFETHVCSQLCVEIFTKLGKSAEIRKPSRTSIRAFV